MPTDPISSSVTGSTFGHRPSEPLRERFTGGFVVKQHARRRAAVFAIVAQQLAQTREQVAGPRIRIRHRPAGQTVAQPPPWHR